MRLLENTTLMVISKLAASVARLLDVFKKTFGD